MTRYMCGDHVEFTARGSKPIKGVIIKLWRRVRRGRRKEIAEAVGMPGSLDVDMARIVPDDKSTGYWDVAQRSIVRKIGDASTKQHVAAVNAAHAVKRARMNRNEQRSSANYAALDSNNFFDLNDGDAIEVNYSDIGWTRVIFRGIVRSSMNVRYEHRGRVRSGPAKLFRKVQVSNG